MNEPSPEANSGIFTLRTIGDVEIALLAATITGAAPRIAPVLGVSGSPAVPEGTPMLAIGGDNGAMKEEVVASLRIMVETHDDKSKTATAARGLLAYLVGEPPEQP